MKMTRAQPNKTRSSLVADSNLQLEQPEPGINIIPSFRGQECVFAGAAAPHIVDGIRQLLRRTVPPQSKARIDRIPAMPLEHGILLIQRRGEALHGGLLLPQIG